MGARFFQRGRLSPKPVCPRTCLIVSIMRTAWFGCARYSTRFFDANFISQSSHSLFRMRPSACDEAISIFLHEVFPDDVRILRNRTPATPGRRCEWLSTIVVINSKILDDVGEEVDHLVLLMKQPPVEPGAPLDRSGRGTPHCRSSAAGYRPDSAAGSDAAGV